MYNKKLKVLDKVFKNTLSKNTAEINDVEIQDFKDKMIKKLDF